MDRLKDEMYRLKAEVARLKEENASCQQILEGETHLRRRVQDNLDEAISAAEYFQGEAKTFRKELMRRGADDPRKPKPPCDTALAALDLVRKWDRDECIEDLRKQRVEHLKRIDSLTSTPVVTLDAGMEEDDESMEEDDV